MERLFSAAAAAAFVVTLGFAQVAPNRFFLTRGFTAAQRTAVLEFDETGAFVRTVDLAPQLPAGIGTAACTGIGVWEITPWGTVLCSTGYHPQGGWFEMTQQGNIVNYMSDAGACYYGTGGVTVGPDGNIYAAHYGPGNSAAVRAFTRYGTPLWTVNNYESWAVAVLDNVIYVGEFLQSPVARFSLSGTPLGTFGSYRHNLGIRALTGNRLLLSSLPVDGGPLVWTVKHMPTGNEMTLNTSGLTAAVNGYGIADVDDLGYIWIKFDNRIYKFSPDNPNPLGMVTLATTEFTASNIAVSGSPGTPIPGGQANSAAASLVVNGVGGSGAGPFNVPLTAGSPLSLQWNGTPNGSLVLFAGGLNPGGLSVTSVAQGCVGTVHVGTPPLYADLRVIFDATASPLGATLFNLGPSGSLLQTATWNGPPGLTFAIQGLVVQPSGSTCPWVLTAAHQLSS
jgi:hypothetical protein